MAFPEITIVFVLLVKYKIKKGIFITDFIYVDLKQYMKKDKESIFNLFRRSH